MSVKKNPNQQGQGKNEPPKKPSETISNTMKSVMIGGATLVLMAIVLAGVRVYKAQTVLDTPVVEETTQTNFQSADDIPGMSTDQLIEQVRQVKNIIDEDRKTVPQPAKKIKAGIEEVKKCVITIDAFKYKHKKYNAFDCDFMHDANFTTPELCWKDTSLGCFEIKIPN